MIKLKDLLPLVLSACAAVSCVRGGDKVESGHEVQTVEKDSIETSPEDDSIRAHEERMAAIRSISTASEALEYMKESGDWDQYRRGIIPQMAEDCLDYARKLLMNDYSGFIIVDKHRMKVILYDRFGVPEKIYGMACAKNFGTKHKKADSRTPEGFFSVEGVYDSTDWLFTDDNGVTSEVKGQFGPRFIRLRIPTTSQIGIHGTCAPWSIGGRRSHGCIRITNENIMELVDLVEVGMPVIVSPGSRDMRVNEEEGYEIPSVATSPGGRKAVAEKIVPKEADEDDDIDDSMNQDTPADEESVMEPVNPDSPESKTEILYDTLR